MTANFPRPAGMMRSLRGYEKGVSSIDTPGIFCVGQQRLAFVDRHLDHAVALADGIDDFHAGSDLPEDGVATI